MKLDVDSIETKIIAGGSGTFARHVKSILVEADQPPQRMENSQIIKLLAGMGFRIRTPAGSDSRNYIFDRKP